MEDKAALEVHRSVAEDSRGHAVVIGGSMAGLLAARVLSDHFERVTIVERDRFPEGVGNRKGVPQGAHVHGLVARGGAALEGMFPGLMGELISDGAPTLDSFEQFLRYEHGGYQAPFEMEGGGSAVLMSRPLLEAHVRRRVSALENVTIMPGHAVAGLTATPDRARVTGVTLRADSGSQREEPNEAALAAGLVVDASGRGSRAPAWLEDMGYGRPPEEKIEIDIGYTTRLYQRRSGDLGGAKAAVIQPNPPHERRVGAMFEVEGGRWMVTLGGYLGEHAPTDERGFLEFSRSLSAPDIYDTIKDAEPLGEAARYKFRADLRRRYERLQSVPEGYLVTGDALCSFNPIYGQGMTVSALEAEALDACLGEGSEDLPRRFYRRAAKAIDAPWRLSAGSDFAYEGVAGNKPPGTDAINWYVGHLQRVATRDPRVCLALWEVTHMLKPPTALLFDPAIVTKVLWKSIARRKAAVSPVPARLVDSSGSRR